MESSMSGFPVLHCLLEFAEIHVHWLGDHPLVHWNFSVTIKEFCRDVDIQGRNTLKILFLFPLSSIVTFALWCCDDGWVFFLSLSFFFFFCLFYNNFQGVLQSSYFQGSFTSVYCIEFYKRRSAFSLQKALDHSLGKYRCWYNWFSITDCFVVFESCYATIENNIIAPPKF